MYFLVFVTVLLFLSFIWWLFYFFRLNSLRELMKTRIFADLVQETTNLGNQMYENYPSWYFITNGSNTHIRTSYESASLELFMGVLRTCDSVTLQSDSELQKNLWTWLIVCVRVGIWLSMSGVIDTDGIYFVEFLAKSIQLYRKKRKKSTKENLKAEVRAGSFKRVKVTIR